jgi:hypothetical protein
MLSLLLSSQAFAHTDHALGDGALHMVYHAVFGALFAVVIFKAVTYFKNKNKQKSDL